MNEVSRNTPDPMVFIREGVNDLGVYLALWNNRQEPDAAARAAADQAVERIETTIRRLWRLRIQVEAEIQRSDAEFLKSDDNPAGD